MKKFAFLLSPLSLAAGVSAQAHWYVSTSGSDVSAGTSAAPFATINHAAVTAAANDVIHIAAGTYGDEQGNILLGTKNLTLVGAGRGVTVLTSHTSATLSLPWESLASPSMIATSNVVTVNGAAAIQLRDMTLDNAFHVAAGYACGVWLGGGADVVCDNVECKNARNNPIGGAQRLYGAHAWGNGGADLTTLTMRNCYVHDFEKGGVYARYAASLDLDDCVIDGGGRAPLGQGARNAVCTVFGGAVTVRRSTITGCWYEPSSDAACGVLVFEAAGAVILEDNDFGGCELAINLFAPSPVTITGLVSRNRIAGADAGFLTQRVSGVSVTDNSFAVSQSFDNDDARDDAGGNTYVGNSYSSLTVSGPHTLPGSGGAMDATAKALMPSFGTNLTTNLPSGYSPVDLAVGDLDGDGDSDFAALCQGSTPSLAIGLDASGVFAVSNLPFGNASGAPVAIIAGQFDGALGRDLAVLTVSVPPVLTENKVYVFANNGAGGFSLLSTYTLTGATAPSGLAAGKLDADAIDDLVVTDAGAAGFVPGKATVLRNTGMGSGFSAVSLVGGYTAACRGAAVGDLDGDGDGDVVVTEGQSGLGKLHRFIGNGLGAYPAVSVTTVSANTNRVLAADVEGDGDIDLLVTSTVDTFGFAPGAVDVLTNTGGGVFVKSPINVDRGPTAIVAGDFDDDADPGVLRRDVAVLNFAGNSISVLGNWSSSGTAGGGIAVAGVLATGLGIGDVNGDGFADLFYSDAVAGTVVVRLAVPQARADSYGHGTTGTSGKVPNLYPIGIPAVPTLGNATFGFGLRNARPFSIAVIAGGVTPGVFPPLLLGDIGATWAVVTTAFGTGAVPLPIPTTPSLAGAALYAQAGVFDANGDEVWFFPGFALSNGLKLRLGY